MGGCQACGFEYDLSQAASAGPAIVDGVTEFGALLSSGSSDLRARREPRTWSALEYGCHVRDVLLVQRERVLAARRTDHPSFEPMGRDERVEHDRHARQDPAPVVSRLTRPAYLCLERLPRLAP